MRRIRLLPFLSLILVCAYLRADDKNSLADLPKHAIEQSQITLPDSHPFHLKASVVEVTNKQNDSYRAKIEEYWMAPDKWRRTVKSAGFSETLVVNGNQSSEQLTGDYYPNWLRTLVEAIFDPGAALHGVDLSKSSDNPRIEDSKLCRRFGYRAGIPPVENRVFATYCFEGKLLDSVGKPGYEAEYLKYKKFGEKQVARKIREYIESGTELEATIDELSELSAPDPSLFTIATPSVPVRTVVVNEETLRGIAITSPPIEWPTIEGGKSSGVLSIYICIDREGRVRETQALNSDHPMMSDAARKQLMGWRFKPAINQGAPVQLESILTFSYTTTIETSKGRRKPL